MALLQLILSLLAKSAGKILNAIFGWAVTALFGRTSAKEQTLLSGLVAASAAWPLLLLGIAFPKVLAFAVAFVPLSDHIPAWIPRVIWIALAALVPVGVGIVVAQKAPGETGSQPWILRLARGFPITAGIAAAFVLMFVTVPVLQAISMMRGRKDEHVVCVTIGSEYSMVAAQIDAMIEGHRLGAVRSEPSWWLSGPATVLRFFGGKAVAGFLPERLAYWRSDDLELAFYPSDVLIRGRNKHTAWTHGLLVEALTRGPGVQTFDTDAQELERRLHRLWALYLENPSAHRNGGPLISSLNEVLEDLGTLKIDYDDWQALYRLTLQVRSAIAGQKPLLGGAITQAEEAATNDAPVSPGTAVPAPPTQSSSTSELVGELVVQLKALTEKEIALARAEGRADLKAQSNTVIGLGIAGLAAITTLNLLLVAGVFVLAASIPAWEAALVLAGAVAIIGGIVARVSWAMRVQQPLARTIKTLKEDIRWAKERLI